MSGIGGVGRSSGVGGTGAASGATAAAPATSAAAARTAMVAYPLSQRDAASLVILNRTQGRLGAWYKADVQADGRDAYKVALYRKQAAPPFAVAPNMAAVYRIGRKTGDIQTVAVSRTEGYAKVATKDQAADAITAHETGRWPTGPADRPYAPSVVSKGKTYEVTLTSKGPDAKTIGTWTVAKDTGDVTKTGGVRFPKKTYEDAAKAINGYIKANHLQSKFPAPWNNCFIEMSAARDDGDPPEVGLTVWYDYESGGDGDGPQAKMRAYLTRLISTTPALQKYKDVDFEFFGPDAT